MAIRALARSLLLKIGGNFNQLTEQRLTALIDDRFSRISKEIQDIKYLSAARASFKDENYKLHTNHHLAYDSWDHKQPKGALNDDTRCSTFVYKMETIFGRKVRVCDLGCAGGGLVYDFLSGGHYAVGIDGSDAGRRRGRAHWGVIPKNLFVADIAEPFEFRNEGGELGTFDLITAWEVMEHIPENKIRALIDNITKHLSGDGFFICSICTSPDYDPSTGAVWHVTVKDRIWWVNMFSENGLVEVSEEVLLSDEFPRSHESPDSGFNLVLKRQS